MRKTFFVVVALLVLGWVQGQQKNNEPLWMRYPVISPDGNYIAFSYQGDLFVVGSEGGQPVQLTRHTAHDTQPIWSVDGKHIVFASDRHGNFDLFVISSEGGKATRLTFNSANEFPESVTPDGKSVLFSAVIQDSPTNYMFPSGVLSELYEVDLTGGRIKQVLTIPAEDAVWNKEHTTLLYQDRKGYEDPWRKHHKSAVTRDLWSFSRADSTYTKLTSFEGEDRNPIWGSNGMIYFLSEQFGSFNVCSLFLENPSQVQQLTSFKTHPVRFLSASNTGKLCYTYDGSIYTQELGKEPKKLPITMFVGEAENNTKHFANMSGIEEMSVSPNGKEIAFIVRGEVFVTSVDYKTTKRITNTPEQERSVSFSPDGDAILYAGERNGSWNLYQTKKVRKEEKYFFDATMLEEEVILASEHETFQPKYSPDGKEVAFLQNRTALAVINLKSKKVRMIMPEGNAYSYQDGDQWYDWSPDSKWFLVGYLDKNLWITEVGLVSAEGGKEIINLTESGYEDNDPKWMLGGDMIIWKSDRNGYRSHGSWGAESDVYAMFTTQDAYNKFLLSKEEHELLKEQEKKDKKKKTKKKDKKKKVKKLEIELDGIKDRVKRLTINSSNLSDAIVTPDGKKLYYLSKFEDGYDLWCLDLWENSTKLVHKLSGYGYGFTMDKDGKNLFFVSGGKIIKLDIASDKKTTVAYQATFDLDKQGELAYIFDHAWRQVKRKFYDPQIHGLDWEQLKKDYAKYLPYINNNHDFADMLGELLGELNGSHTGCRYRPHHSDGDRTAQLGILIDYKYEGEGVRIAEILEQGPLFKSDKKVVVGDIITKINGEKVKHNADLFRLLNRKAGKDILLTIGRSKDIVVKPISRRKQSQLVYNRWVKLMRNETEKLSGGRLGYVHVKGMNSASFRKVYSDLLGRYADKEAVIVDTRFNGGGWLHDDLVTLLSGKPYWKYTPRGQDIGHDPLFKWNKPSIVLIGEGNYSDAHGFPYAYKALEIGKLVGMPVPGTFTAVWWETQIDNSLVFGIPQVGAKGMDGKYLENQQLEPDVKVLNEMHNITNKKDQQLETAVKELLFELDGQAK